jgi:peptide/nickel transport system permease protein
VVGERLPATARLAAMGLFFAVIISLPAGIIAALNRNRLPDYVSSFLSVLGQAMPNFWLGIMLILVFAITLGWFPVSGQDQPLSVVLPGLALGTGLAAVLTRLLRSSLIEVLNQDYIRTAHAKGIRPNAIIVRHALRNALLSYLTVIGLEASSLMAGAVVTEQVFAWPGIGLLAIQAINYRDMAVVQTVVIVAALIVMIISLVVDVLYSIIDPRIQHG